jgi:DNA-binding transcriptional MerR regulator
MVDEGLSAEDDGGQFELHGDAGRQRPRKTADAFRTISEVADELHVPQHVLRFWETKFPQVRPLKRGGGRRYYRPEDVLLLRRVADLLYTQGYTIKGVQRLLREGGGSLQENIPPASPEERQAAEVERVQAAADKPEPPLLSMPVLSPVQASPLPSVSPAPKVVVPVSASQIKATVETERLRSLLKETLEALEKLRNLLG